MKKLLVFLLFCSSFANAQTLNYFTNDPAWSLEARYSLNGECETVEEYAYFFNGDTTINQVLYKKLWKRGLTYEVNIGGPQGGCNTNTSYFFYIERLMRQSNDSIFYYDIFSEMEELMLTYNLTVGDTLPITPLVQNTYVVQAVDSVLINSEYHRKFVLDSLDDNYVIEGVGHFWLGAYQGEFVILFAEAFELTPVLICYSQNDSTVWNNPNTIGICNYHVNVNTETSISENKRKDKLNLFPNLAHDWLNVDVGGEVIETVTIYNLTGSVVQTVKVLNQQNLAIEISKLDAGVYHLIAESRSGTLFTNKLFKQ